MNGMRVKELELEDRAFLRNVVACQLARVVDGVIWVRNPSDVGYQTEYTNALRAAAHPVRAWWAIMI